MSGSSKLTGEQTDQLEKLFGHRYTHIQTDASILSRRERRKLGWRGNVNPGARTVPR